MSILFGIVLLITGVLQVILFFKIWGMTDDVKSIKKEFIEYDPYKTYAKTFAVAAAKEYLSSRPKVAKINGLCDTGIICVLSPQGGYDVTTLWNLHVKSESEIYERNYSVTVHITCSNCSVPIMPESWKAVVEPAVSKTVNSTPAQSAQMRAK